MLLADDAESRVSVPEDDDNVSCDEALSGSGGTAIIFLTFGDGTLTSKLFFAVDESVFGDDVRGRMFICEHQPNVVHVQLNSTIRQ